MRRRLLIAAGLACPVAAQPAFIPTAGAVALLRAGGLNLYLRHAITDRSQTDQGLRGVRAAQRNLSSAGEAQARALGEAFRRLAIPVAEVLTSEVYRARETAELAFGRANIHPNLIADDYTTGNAATDAATISALLGTPPGAGNRVLVGHIVPLGLILGRGLAQQEFPEGGMAVFRPGWSFLGFVAAEQLIGA